MPITVSIPVGPHSANKRWLEPCVRSVLNQSFPPTEILIIDDQAHVNVFETMDGKVVFWDDQRAYLEKPDRTHLRKWTTPWLSGVAHAFNFGVALARNEIVVMLGSDDILQPWALEDLIATIQKSSNERLAYYYFQVEYMDTHETQDIPCHAAAVSKSLWHHNGGFPVESAIGAPDTMLISIMMANPEAGKIIRVDSQRPPYLYRRHGETDTATRPPFDLTSVRDILTREWKKRWLSRIETT